MKTLFFIFLILTAALRAGEAIKELRLNDNTVLHDVQVKAVTPDGLKVIHRDGAGLLKKENLPPGTLEKFAAAFAEAAAKKEKEEREIAETRRKQALERQELIDRIKATKGIEVKVTAVKEGTGFFRYYLTAHDIGGKERDGKLMVRYETRDHPAGTNVREVNIKMGADGSCSGNIDWFTGPPCRHGTSGVLRLQWVLKTKDGRFEGVADVPNKITDTLAVDEKMKD